MDENDELEEGELLEDEEERRRKNKSTNRWKNDNPERFNKTSYEKGKQQRNSGILRTAIAAITSNSAGEMRNQKRRPSVEDEEELLRQHLLKSMASQENRSNAKQAKKANLQQQGKQSKSQRLEENEASTSSSTIPMAQNATSSESNAADDIENLTQALLDAKRKHSELMERKQTIQQSLITCEADLELAGQEVSNLIERISTAWSRQFNSLNPQKVEKPEVKINAENEKMEEENNNHQIPVESSTTIPQIAAVEQQDKGGDTGGGEENTIQIAQIPVEQQQKSGVTKNMGEEENPTTNISFSEPIQPTNVNDVEQQSKIAQEDEELEDGQIMDETIEDGQIIDQTMEEEMAQTQTNIIIEENLEQRKDLAENNANQMEEVENRVEEMREIADNRSQQFDPFLVSIRSYRLSPLFPQGLISHPAISNRLNPYIPLCPYQLDGRCADRQCPYQHEEDYLLSEQQIIEEIIGYWPKICPNGMQPSEYAANLLANGPFDQVVGFLISRMPDSIRIGGQKQPFQMKSTAKTKPNSGEDDRVEYESILNKALNFAGNTITIQNQM